jgi:transcriptional regulator with XRE-family HTH domain
MITGKQVRAARNLLGWSQMKLAVKAEIALQTIAEVETRKKLTAETTLARIQRALEIAGVEFPEFQPPRLKAGVRLRKGR